MAVLVTGAAGFLGSHVCDRLLEAKEEVVGLDSFDDFYARRIKEENLERARGHSAFALVEADIREADLLDRLPSSIDAVIHLAARAGVRRSINNPVLCADVNMMGTATLLDWIKRRGIGSFLFASSSAVYGDNTKVPFSEEDPVEHPLSPYAASKRSGELLCHTASHLGGITVACLRLFTVHGPRQRPDLAIRKFAEILSRGGEVPLFGDGSSSRDYTFVDDAVMGLMGALSWARRGKGRCEVFNLGNDHPVALSEMVETLAEVMGVEARTRFLPAQPGDAVRSWADITKAKEILGYRPATSFRVGITRFLEWL